MISVIGSNKGGASKSTIATNVAVALALRGADVAIVDADLQASSTKWHSFREESQIAPSITLIQKTGNIAQTLRQLDDKYDHVIVDVAGRNSREFITAGAVAHVIISPHLCSQFDLDTLETLEFQLQGWQDLNPDVKLHMYHSRASTNPVLAGTERADFLGFLADFPTLIPLDAIQYERKAYRDVISMGLGVLEFTNEKAKAEVNALIEEVYAEWL